MLSYKYNQGNSFLANLIAKELGLDSVSFYVAQDDERVNEKWLRKDIPTHFITVDKKWFERVYLANEPFETLVVYRVLPCKVGDHLIIKHDDTNPGQHPMRRKIIEIVQLKHNRRLINLAKPE